VTTRDRSIQRPSLVYTATTIWWPPPAIGGLGHQQGLAQAGVSQDKVMIALEQHQLLPQAAFAFARCGTPASNRCHALT
jgi:hypothetical protein